MNLVERAFAELSGSGTSISINPDTDTAPTSIQDFIFSAISNVIIPIAGAIAVLYLIYSGILYLTAAGNPDAAKKGQQGVVNAIIGIIIIALSYVIIKAVSGTVGGTTI